MATDRFIIAPLNSGLETDVRPFLLPDDAFSQLNNAYVFRGRVRKRFGSYLLNGSVDASVAQQYSRLRVNIGTSAAVTGNFGPFVVPGAIWEAGQMFSIGDTMFTVISNAAGPQAMLSTGAATGTFDVATGTVTITGNNENPSTAVYFYPAQPVMGFPIAENATINDEMVIAFDTQFAYEFTGGAWERLANEAAPGDATWTGNNAQFFWGANWTSTAYDRVLFVTNFNQNEPNFMRYFLANTWNSFRPTVSVLAAPVLGITLDSGRIIVPFHNRLVILNTWERETADGVTFNLRNYPSRARYSQVGSPLDANAWRQDIAGRGNAIDASTTEAIITAEFLKDRLIVYFERSTWELVYTGNQNYPFTWQQINTELGAESTFSVVPFDKVILGVGNVGIHACSGQNVDRIDFKIPDSVFEVTNNNEGVFRVYGIRDYFVEMVYWTFPSTEAATFPRRVLVYNYKTGSWAFNDDSITAFGYFQNPTGITWAASEQTWEQGIEPWSSATLLAQFRQIIAGNQQGFTFICDADESRNAPSLQITNITFPAGVVTLTVINHNLSAGDFIAIENLQGLIGPFFVIYQIASIIDADTFTITAPDIAGAAGTYTGGGTIARISRIDIFTKQYNFYLKQGRNFTVNKIDFYVDKTTEGQITVDTYPSAGVLPVDSLTLDTSPYSLYPYEEQQLRVWHPIYPSAEGEFIQLRIYLSDAQMMVPAIAWSDFELNSMIFYTNPTASRLQ